MNDVKFVQLADRIGAALPSSEGVSGILFYSSTLPTADAGVTNGFASTDRCKVVFSVAEAEGLGIKASVAGFSALHYHISEYFRRYAEGVLYLGIYPLAAQAADYFKELVELSNFAEGAISQYLVYAPTLTFASTQVSSLQAVADSLKDLSAPAVLLYQGNFASLQLSALPNLASGVAADVAVLIGQSGSGRGAELYGTLGYSIGMGGALMALLASKNVGWSAEWVQEFNFTIGEEFNTIAFANGALYRAQSVGLLNQLSDRRYVFLRKHIGTAGSYVAGSVTAAPETNDFCFIERNRTINKARRALRSSLIPFLSGPLRLEANGNLSPGTVSYLKELAEKALFPLEAEENISAFSVSVANNQPVLQTKKVRIGVAIVPLGAARDIEVVMEFNAQIINS